MAAYKCIFKADDRADSEALYNEFTATCSNELVPAYSGSEAWTGVRVFDVRGVNRLGELPLLRSLLEQIGFENVVMVNYYNMAPRSAQHKHRDQSGNLLFGISRLHVALRTNEQAFLEVEGQRYHIPPNEIWCLDTSGRHAAANDSDEGRVHLVIDVKRSPTTGKYFPRMTAAVYLHLIKFVFIMGFKLLRDAISKPSTIAGRLPYIIGMLIPRSTSK